MKGLKKIDVGCYYFPNYHFCDERNIAYHGAGWSEWELVKKAIPRFSGHQQPKIPLWGYTDESDPMVMEQKIAAAANAGINYFIYDYYYYNDGSFLEHGLNDGLLKAKNLGRVKFCLMWANHNWTDIHPCNRKQRTLLYAGKINHETFEKMCNHVIERYFCNPAYYCIDGAPYFSIYDVKSFLESCGGEENARIWLDAFRNKTRAVGFPDLHLNAIIQGRPILPGEENNFNIFSKVEKLGVNSITSYVWFHHVKIGPQREACYLDVLDGYLKYWKQVDETCKLPYYPNVTMGWDSSPRTIGSEIWSQDVGYPYTPIVINNSPENFGKALEAIKERLLQGDIRNFNINSWNEWTEGSMIEPEIRYGTAYLDSIKKVFGGNDN